MPCGTKHKADKKAKAKKAGKKKYGKKEYEYMRDMKSKKSKK